MFLTIVSPKALGTSSKRILKEHSEITLDPPPNCSAGPKVKNDESKERQALRSLDVRTDQSCSLVLKYILDSNH